MNELQAYDLDTNYPNYIAYESLIDSDDAFLVLTSLDWQNDDL